MGANASLHAYETLLYRGFGYLPHTLYMAMRDGHIEGGFREYLLDYQRLNAGDQLTVQNPPILKTMQTSLAQRGIEFYYVLLPDKKTIYPEHMPTSYRVLNQPSRTQRYLQNLADAGVNTISLIEPLPQTKAALQQAAQQTNGEPELLYNRKFDVLHWNDTGRFYGCQYLRA